MLFLSSPSTYLHGVGFFLVNFNQDSILQCIAFRSRSAIQLSSINNENQHPFTQLILVNIVIFPMNNILCDDI